MRQSKEVKAANHKKIVIEAARLFRLKGVEGTSVAEVMSAAGMTHGGFYRHFKNKDELLGAAINQAVDVMINLWREDIDAHGVEKAARIFVDTYLSLEHVQYPHQGCPIAALSNEVSRYSPIAVKAFRAGSEQFIHTLALALTGDEKTAKAKAVGIFTTMVGTVVLARNFGAGSQVAAILAAGRTMVETVLPRA